MATAKSKSIDLKRIGSHNDDLRDLYLLLKKRSYSISHNLTPTFEEHTNFVKNHPYRYWYLIRSESTLIGSAYFAKDNSIGLSLIIKDRDLVSATVLLLIKKHSPLQPIKSIRSASFHFNVNPKNTLLIDVLMKLGLKHIQSTYSTSTP